jgi:hypothetical protein
MLGTLIVRRGGFRVLLVGTWRRREPWNNGAEEASSGVTVKRRDAALPCE